MDVTKTFNIKSDDKNLIESNIRTYWWLYCLTYDRRYLRDACKCVEVYREVELLQPVNLEAA